MMMRTKIISIVAALLLGLGLSLSATPADATKIGHSNSLSNSLANGL